MEIPNRSIRPTSWSVALAFLLAIGPADFARAQPSEVATFEQWGRETYATTKQYLGRPGESLYYGTRNINNGSTGGVNGYAYVWPLGTQFRAINQLAKLDPANFTSEVTSLAAEMHAGYWRFPSPLIGNYRIGGYAADFNYFSGTRFYDDNAHLVIAYIEAYRLTADPTLLQRAKDTYAFVKSGEWIDSNGRTEGIRFVEDPNDLSSNTISVLQAVRGAALIFQETGEQKYRDDAIKLMAWADSNVRTPQGLYNQDYNRQTQQRQGIELINAAGIGITAHIELYRITGQQSYLNLAIETAQATVGRFYNPVLKVLNDEGYWGFELAEAYNLLTLQTGDLQWLRRTMAGLRWLHENKRDTNGNYGVLWGREGRITSNIVNLDLNDMAPVTDAYLDTANTLKALNLPEPSTDLLDLRFDETAGTLATDRSNQRNDATTIGSPVWTSGLYGNALDLDSIDDSVRLPAGLLSVLKDCTVATWVNLDSIDDWSRIFDFGDDTSNFMFLTPRNGATGVVRFEIHPHGANSQLIEGTAPLPVGRWVHVAVTLAGSTGRLYVDGVEVGSNPNISVSPADLGITQNNFLGKSKFPDPLLNGRIDDFKILTRALSVAEINALAGLKAPPAHTYLRLDEGIGTIATDSTGNGRQAQLVNGPTFAPGRINGAVCLDGSDDHLTFSPGIVSGLTAYTVATWVRWQGTPSASQCIFDFGTGNTTYMSLTPQSPTGTVRFAISNNGAIGEQVINGTVALPTGVWTHVAITQAGGVGTLYVNGSAVGTNKMLTLTPSALGTTNENYLGRSRSPAAPYFNGCLDEFQLHDRALSPAEISLLAVPLQPPTHLVASGGNGAVALAWNPVQNALRYNVLRSDSGDYAIIGTTQSVPTFVDSTVNKDTTYHYVVTAQRSLSESANSNIATYIPPSYNVWASLNFNAVELADPLLSGSLADFDKDGISNLEEYAFGGNPKVPDRSILPVVDIGDAYLVANFTRLLDRTDITYTVRATPDMVNYDTVARSLPGAASEALNGGDVKSTPDLADPNKETVEARDHTPINAATHRFMRVEVSRP